MQTLTSSLRSSAILIFGDDNTKRYIKCSNSTNTITGKTWDEFIKNIESQTKFKVDSASKRRYCQFIDLIDGPDLWEGEVTKYSDGSYELLMDNVEYVG